MRVASVYVIGHRQDGALKIGFSVDPVHRLRQLRPQQKCRALELLYVRPTDYARGVEDGAHQILKHCRVSREWFVTDLGTAKDAIALSLYWVTVQACQAYPNILPNWREIAEAAP